MFEAGRVYEWSDGVRVKHVLVRKRTNAQLELLLEEGGDVHKARIKRGCDGEVAHTLGGRITDGVVEVEHSKFGKRMPALRWVAHETTPLPLRHQVFVLHTLDNYDDVVYWRPNIRRWKATIEKDTAVVRTLGYYERRADALTHREEIQQCQQLLV